MASNAGGGKSEERGFIPALKRAFRQFASLLPVMAGVVLLIGLFKSFLTSDMITGIFPEAPFSDAFFGTLTGSLLAGNPINSYLIGQELLNHGVSLFGITGFMTAWVTVGLLQLPAEISALGKRFALSRNVLSFIICMAISILTAGLFYLIKGQ